jgi:protein-S-isoprenylcysteine O-methyltransferase Ste14
MAKPRGIGFRLRGVAGIVVLVPMVVAIVISRRWAHVEYGTPGGLACDIAGWLVFIVAAFFRLSAIIFVGGRKGKGVVTHGPYSMCRNPLYLGSLLMAVSGALMLHCISAVPAIIVVSIFYLMVVIPSEENQLHEAFPKEWEAFVASTPRLIPRFRWITEGESIEVNLRAIRNEALRVIGMGAIPLMAIVIAFVRTKPWWPKWDVLLP